MRQWYSIRAAAGTATLTIYDEIGRTPFSDDPAVSAKQFAADLQALPPAVRHLDVHVSSPGGDVAEALTIANALVDQRRTKGRTVDMHVDGLAASAASLVIMAGSRIKIADNALVMVHEPHSLTVGNAKDLRATAEALDRFRAQMVTTYQWHSPLTEEAILALLAAETWMDADQAIANGFATEKVEGLQAATAVGFRPAALARLNVPDVYRPRIEQFEAKAAAAPIARRRAQAPADADAMATLRACREAGLDVGFAEQLVAAGLSSADMQSRIAAERTVRDQATARAQTIRALCGVAKLPQLADDYIKFGVAISNVRELLVTLQVLRDPIEIDGAFTSYLDGNAPAAKAPNTSDVYRRRNKEGN